MSEPARVFVLREPVHRERAIAAVADTATGAEPPFEVIVRRHRAKRSLEQNAAMWAMLGEIAKAVEWHGQMLTPEDWKNMFTAALKRYRVVPGIDGGFAVVGMSTSAMTVAEMSELIDLIAAFASEHGVTGATQ